jgi:hypothetical protein
MTGDNYVILVINRAQADADNLKELIEFMDTPNVRTALPGQWRQQLGDRRLEALFVGPDLSTDEIDTLLVDVGEFDPNVPIVMMQAEGTA